LAFVVQNLEIDAFSSIVHHKWRIDVARVHGEPQ